MDHQMHMQLAYDLARMRARAGEINVTRHAV
jgi:hypothetical protein